MRMPTRSPTPCASRSRHCANASASRGSSPPCPGPGTASAPNRTPGMIETTVDRAPGLSVRLKLTLSYAGFLMLAGVLLIATVGLFLLRKGQLEFNESGAVQATPGTVFLKGFAPTAAASMAFLLVFGLLGGWILAGRMLAPLTRITDATRTATTGSLSHRI